MPTLKKIVRYPRKKEKRPTAMKGSEKGKLMGSPDVAAVRQDMEITH